MGGAPVRVSQLGRARDRQGFDASADRQTYAGGWEAADGDVDARRALKAKLDALRRGAAKALRRPLEVAALDSVNERTYNWRACRVESTRRERILLAALLSRRAS